MRAFYGILKVLIALGPVFFFDVSTGYILFRYSVHVKFNHNIAAEYMFGEGLLFYLLIIVSMPLYICLVRPFIFKYVPGMLKSIGLGILFMVASLICTLIMETVVHMEQEKHFGCMFQTFPFKFFHGNDIPGSICSSCAVFSDCLVHHGAISSSL